VNGLQATGTDQAGLLATMMPVERGPDPTDAPAGFPNLISAISSAMNPLESAPRPDQSPAKQIADALIRAMLGANVELSALGATAPPIAPGASAQSNPSQSNAPAIRRTVLANLPALSIGAASVAAASITGANITIDQAPVKAPRFGLAFSLRLTCAEPTQPGALPTAGGVRTITASDANSADALKPEAPGAPAPEVPIPTAQPATGVQAAVVSPLSTIPACQAQPAYTTPLEGQPAEPALAQDTPAQVTPAQIIKDKPASAARADHAESLVSVVAAAASQGASPDHSGNPGQPFQASSPEIASLQNTGTSAEAPFQAAGEAIRTAEPVVAAVPLSHPALAQEITVRIAQPDLPAVDVHLLDRAGQVQVAVRTPDATLQSSLRQDLGSLVNSLERAGYHAETTSATREAAPFKTLSSQMNSHDDRQPQPGNSGRGGAGGSFDKPQQQKQRSQRIQNWLEELEKQS
jgi:hypothetical protein